MDHPFEDIRNLLEDIQYAFANMPHPFADPHWTPWNRDRDTFPLGSRPNRPGRHDPAAEDLFITMQELSLLVSRKLLHNGIDNPELGQQIRDKQATAEQHPWFKDITIDERRRRSYRGSRNLPFSDDFISLWRRLTQITEVWKEEDDVYTKDGQRHALRMLMCNMACATLDGQRLWTIENRYLDERSPMARWA